MPYDPNLYHRRSVRLRGFDYASAGAYFVTICTHERLCTLGTVLDGSFEPSPAGLVVEDVWSTLPRRFAGLETDAFVVMPNHIHGVFLFVEAQFIAPDQLQFIAPNPPAVQARRPVLGEVVRTLKAASARLIRRAGDTAFAWQRGYYEHVVRNDADLRRIRDYVEGNPAKWDQDPENPAVDGRTARDWMTERLRAR